MTEDKYDRLAALVQKLQDVRKNVLHQESLLKIWKEKEKGLVETEIPSFMKAYEIESFKAADLDVSVEEQVFARIPVEKKKDAFQWLRDHNEAGMIKEELVTSVHPQTLKAWVRGKLKEGAELPEDLFGIFVKTVAKVK